ncbi:hypothetical protein F4777DRAFT_178552 [Nemania sp. FL0916]|nr:hypothetical protein F4777DRAFT_178552 [Nemania sp. FL0916]
METAPGEADGGWLAGTRGHTVRTNGACVCVCCAVLCCAILCCTAEGVGAVTSVKCCCFYFCLSNLYRYFYLYLYLCLGLGRERTKSFNWSWSRGHRGCTGPGRVRARVQRCEDEAAGVGAGVGVLAVSADGHCSGSPGSPEVLTVSSRSRAAESRETPVGEETTKGSTKGQAVGQLPSLAKQTCKREKGGSSHEAAVMRPFPPAARAYLLATGLLGTVPWLVEDLGGSCQVHLGYRSPTHSQSPLTFSSAPIWDATTYICVYVPTSRIARILLCSPTSELICKRDHVTRKLYQLL